MRADLFLIADFIEMADSGKFNARGAGVNRVMLPSLPASIPSIGAVLRFVVEDHDRGRPHSVVVSMTDPDGREFGRSENQLPTAATSRELDPDGSRQLTVTLISNFSTPAFTAYGWHTIAYIIDGEVVGGGQFLVHAEELEPLPFGDLE